MARPIRYCRICGHYVDERPVTRGDMFRQLRTVTKLCHIDADGRRLDHLAHQAIEDVEAEAFRRLIPQRIVVSAEAFDALQALIDEGDNEITRAEDRATHHVPIGGANEA